MSTKGHGEDQPKRERKPRVNRPPVDDKTRARVRKLAREGMSRNAIARETDVTQWTVSRICAEARPPITFDRSRIKTATEAKVVDAKARRAVLAGLMLDDAFTLRARALGKKTVLGFEDGETVSREVDYDAVEVKHLFTAVGIVIDKHLTLTDHDGVGGNLSSVEAWIQMMTGKTKSAEPVPAGWE
jgi:hypothetical protein